PVAGDVAGQEVRRALAGVLDRLQGAGSGDHLAEGELGSSCLGHRIAPHRGRGFLTPSSAVSLTAGFVASPGPTPPGRAHPPPPGTPRGPGLPRRPRNPRPRGPRRGPPPRTRRFGEPAGGRAPPPVATLGPPPPRCRQRSRPRSRPPPPPPAPAARISMVTFS